MLARFDVSFDAALAPRRLAGEQLELGGGPVRTSRRAEEDVEQLEGIAPNEAALRLRGGDERRHLCRVRRRMILHQPCQPVRVKRVLLSDHSEEVRVLRRKPDVLGEVVPKPISGPGPFVGQPHAIPIPGDSLADGFLPERAFVGEMVEDERVRHFGSQSDAAGAGPIEPELCKFGERGSDDPQPGVNAALLPSAPGGRRPDLLRVQASLGR